MDAPPDWLLAATVAILEHDPDRVIALTPTTSMRALDVLSVWAPDALERVRSLHPDAEEQTNGSLSLLADRVAQFT